MRPWSEVVFYMLAGAVVAAVALRIAYKLLEGCL